MMRNCRTRSRRQTVGHRHSVELPDTDARSRTQHGTAANACTTRHGLMMRCDLASGCNTMLRVRESGQAGAEQAGQPGSGQGHSWQMGLCAFWVISGYSRVLGSTRTRPDFSGPESDSLRMALCDDPPRKSFSSKFRLKKFTVAPSRATQPDEGEGPSVPPLVVPTTPPRGQQQSPSQQGQGPSDLHVVVPPYFPSHFPPSSTSPHYPSPDQTHASPFYLYYPPPSSQAAGPSTGPLPPYSYPYYYPYPVQHK
ncbi:hypothetical protein MA16_Dca022132 [Dendrobium catenatum]|uniref:Uncharacterized protein n=1 Tax=Dendrobium catenatum TaxID=906689 RepID=A0A2I0W2W9_9ASPA|nr:hypothetical protein MA16_Dca022132 [Dendrobium catenatum]